MRKIICFLLVASFVLSCEKEETFTNPQTEEELDDIDFINEDISSFPTGGEDGLRIAFGKAVSGALKDSQSFRELIKNEALEMFDMDYDVLYHLIKHKIVNEGSVRELLLKHISEDKLARIETELPLLTIHVPNLLSGDFSAYKWDTNFEIPEVGVKSNNFNDILMLKPDGNSYILHGAYAPSFPAVAIVDNDRVLVNMNESERLSSNGMKVKRGKRLIADKGLTFTLIDESFDGSNANNKYDKIQRLSKLKGENSIKEASRAPSSPHQKLFGAYNHFPNSSTGWQRDYVYYNFTSQNDRSTRSLEHGHMEELVMFGFKATYANGQEDVQHAISMWNRISSGDAPRHGAQAERISAWSQGDFEFDLIYTLSPSGDDEPEAHKRIFGFAVSELFTVEVRSFRNIGNKYYRGYVKGAHNVYLPIGSGRRLKLFEWDLGTYSNNVLFTLMEHDNGATITEEKVHSWKFAANLEAVVGDIKKLGAKLGLSPEISRSKRYQISYTDESDDLGTFNYRFKDRIVRSNNNNHIQFHLHGDAYKIAIAPVYQEN